MKRGDTTQEDIHVEDEVIFDEAGDLGISVRVDGDGAVVVSKLLQLRGYAELTCPTLRAGNALVVIDNVPVVDLSFPDVMKKLHATADTRPTRLEFVGVDTYETIENAVSKWQQSQCLIAPSDDDLRSREGEFDVGFRPQQPTGLRFSEGYIMTNPLKLAHVEPALVTASALRGRGKRERLLATLTNSILVRLHDDSVLGAPVDDVMALLYDVESFPKTLWLAQPERLQSNFYVVTLTSREQLMWLCFVPIELMMEVPVISYATVASGNDATTTPSRRRRMRSDGVREDQYLMAINGFPTLRISSGDSFSTDSETDGIVAEVNKALGTLLPYNRTLRFRDLKAYRREFLAHEPLSPWQRRRLKEASEAITSCSSTVGITSPNSTATSPAGSSTSGTESGAHSPGTEERDDLAVRIQHHPQAFAQILQCQAMSQDDQLTESPQESPADNAPTEPTCVIATATRRPHIKKRYEGLADCEGKRTFLRAKPDNVKTVVIPDNRRPVGMQLETDLQSQRPVFKCFLQRDGPARASRSVRIGDKILAVNGVAIDDIPTDMLVRILHGEDTIRSDQGPTPTPPAIYIGGSRKRLLDVGPPAPRRRVLRLQRLALPPQQSLLGHAKKIITFSRLSFWSKEGKDV